MHTSKFGEMQHMLDLTKETLPEMPSELPLGGIYGMLNNVRQLVRSSVRNKLKVGCS